MQRSGTIAHPPDKKRRLEKRERKRRQSLDGDGSWRQTTGERRTDHRRSSDDESGMVNLPFLDDEFEADSQSNSSELSNPSSNGNTQARNSLLESRHETNTQNHTDNDSPAGTESENADAKASAMSDTQNRKSLSPEEQARLNSLKTMLNASNARYKQATKNRRPVFAAGLEVLVTKGEYAGKLGVILDADYIENRALISLPDQASPRWIGFSSLGHSD